MKINFYAYIALGGIMKKKVGVLVRPNLDRFTINRELSDKICEYDCIPIGIIPTCDEGKMSDESYQDMIDLISLCDGVILQGGTDFYDYDLKTVKYLYEHDIPVLGICLGMQTMGCVYNGKLMDVVSNDHYYLVDYVHPIAIKEDSKLYSILNKKTIIVNSRHHQQIVGTDLKVSATYNNVIEAVEDPSKKFFIGVQWHPESIDDDNSKALFQAFFNSI